MNAVSMLEQLQDVAVTALAADPMFVGQSSANGAAIPIVLERKGDIETQIEMALGQVGIMVLVVTPLFRFINRLLPALSGWALLEVTVGENVPVNQGNGGTKIRAIDLAQHVLCLLHHLKTGLPVGPNDQGVAATLMGAEPPLTIITAGPVIGYGLHFEAQVILTG
jgi:hypothetical protein